MTHLTSFMALGEEYVQVSNDLSHLATTRTPTHRHQGDTSPMRPCGLPW